MAIGQTKSKITFTTSLSFSSSSSSSTSILRRKRVAVSTVPIPSGPHSPVRTLRKQRSTRLHMDEDDTVSLLESLPQEILVKLLCKVNHSDLKHLLLVSKPVSKATTMARELHFAFATPSSKIVFGVDENSEEEGGPWAPKQYRVARSRIQDKNLASITVNLSTSFDKCRDVYITRQSL
ncbi:hypothetical protein GUJ93_ZPchr0007g3593 [Zizania palustris]|uniref:F-box domain-containing protein n=1 Tax=Zizania palustris TaxID=103762 RepID=A0A8J5TFS6_ZIZPA|nr:hypothetical protein GUJ93_ZPchr0007g3593 [Zizania palustris]